VIKDDWAVLIYFGLFARNVHHRYTLPSDFSQYDEQKAAKPECYPVAKHLELRFSSGNAECVHDPVATTSSEASYKVPSLHSTPVVLPFCRMIFVTFLLARTFPLSNTTFDVIMANPWVALAHPPSKFKYPARLLNPAVRTCGGKMPRIARPSGNFWSTAPTAMSLWYESSA
jgi:hypothetical protein